MVVLHDIYFYTTHRLMHLPPLFKAVHAGHHRSLTPTPWSILSFQPLETISQFGFFAAVIFFVPLHPGTLLAYLLFDGIVNAAGHCGHEFVAPASQKHWLLKYLNAVTHHDLHHTRFRHNFGQYFNILDRLFGTFLDRPAA
jgi:sterol desaturase/sphingolipid hydroxylase (fatty acid hydroxylase superfamily)